ncbi:bifunctional glutamate--cysteine ligase GshA/glutathione synthetase GshB [Rubritalea profundi]|uniref:Glutamate--cysteine ligase n=1 Tax=Rubritalea profundi TaxID=1658618 RepID=A0A2S7TZ56_9BACT|nr:bifunctional glutamate--cysteine ligase GshA/glutathione synthetase GshB [Rubritalea profundi]PQJ28038.1 bifunctional glutamate--cysteine ligase/glutathione synthetase [Rubritalea profundi]
MQFRDALTVPSSRAWLFKGKFGLEKEHIRVDRSGKLALSPHPAVFGDKLANPYVTVDFSESQLEMITPPVGSMDEALGFMETIHDIVTENLADELLWPQSMPPALPEDGSQIPLAQFTSEHRALTEYRRFLAQTYGRKKQMISGVHVNISLSETLIEKLFDSSASEHSLGVFRSQLYMKALRNMMRHRWMMIALLGNSPAADKSYITMCPDLPQVTPNTCCGQKTVSVRASICGYKNNEDFVLDYTDWSSFHRLVRDLVDAGKLIHEKELYSPIRIKTHLQTGEITHLEMRMLDLDPTTKVGIRPESLHLLHLYMLWAMTQDEPKPFDSEQQKIATQNQYHCACCGFDSKIVGVDGVAFPHSSKKEVSNFLSEISALVPAGNDSYSEAVRYFQNQLDSPELSPLEQSRKGIHSEGFIEYNLTQAKAFQQVSSEQTFRFNGLEDLELSTQLMLREAVLRGIRFNLLDRDENFVQFEKDGHTEYIQQATKTSKDNYATILMMENKLVTKKVLHAANLTVPLGGHYTDAAHAKADYFRYQAKPIVVKPKSTNFGLGISILKQNENQQHYDQAIDMAFAEDTSVLVEPFVEGREFRFFLINGAVEGILHRVPANVCGDGALTIAELVALKNQDPLRGKGYVTPLEKIELGQAECLFLETQDLTVDDIPSEDETIYLRENSNISTGGDSIDFTDEVHPSYKRIASLAAKAVAAEITGLDMIIPDIDIPASAENYSIIEMNFNPAIHIHCFPYRGKNRHLNSKLMTFLGF